MNTIPFLLAIIALLLVVNVPLYAQDEPVPFPEDWATRTACLWPEGAVDIFDDVNYELGIPEPTGYPHFVHFEDTSFYIDEIGLETGAIYGLALPQCVCQMVDGYCSVHNCYVWRLADEWVSDG